MAKSQHLRPEPGVGAEADEEQLDEEADQGVGEGVEHRAGPCQVGRIICGRREGGRGEEADGFTAGSIRGAEPKRRSTVYGRTSILAGHFLLPGNAMWRDLRLGLTIRNCHYKEYPC